MKIWILHDSRECYLFWKKNTIVKRKNIEIIFWSSTKPFAFKCITQAQRTVQETPISWQTDHFGVTFFAFSQIPVFGHQSTSKFIINPMVTNFISMAITWPISVHKIKIKKITRFDITYVNTKKKIGLNDKTTKQLLMRHFANWIYVITYVIKHLSLSLKIQFKMAKLTEHTLILNTVTNYFRPGSAQATEVIQKCAGATGNWLCQNISMNRRKYEIY